MSDTESVELKPTLHRRHNVVESPANAADREAADDTGGSALTLMEQIVLMSVHDRTGQLASVLNDTISFVLRGCILLELAFMRCIFLAKAPVKRNAHDRIVLVRDAASTGSVLLDEALRIIRSDKQSISSWLDLLSGETWNPLKTSYQLRQVRERVAKGLVDKGILNTGRSSLLLQLVSMPTHPIAQRDAKEELITSIVAWLGPNPPSTKPPSRMVALVAAAYSGNVLEGALAKRLPPAFVAPAVKKAQQWLHSHAAVASSEPVEECLAAVLSVFCRLDNLLY